MTRTAPISLATLAALGIGALFAGAVALTAVEAQDATLTRATHADPLAGERAAAARLLDRLGYRDAEGVRRRGELVVVEATDRFGVRRRLVLSLSEGLVIGEQALPRASQQ